jgi:3'-phosphoadenosine 5'-phosphosulfate sulfotransferase (PAPS reductase)/FAD synthetase
MTHWPDPDPASPYFCHGPTMLSVSGGRTSGRMLYETIAAHGGRLPDYVHIGFANTGKEREPTLRFVHDMSTHWEVRIRWLEFVTDLASAGAAGRFEEVGFNSASRNGEPFDRLIERKQAIPFGTKRFCTEFLKVKVLFDFAETIGLGRPGQFAETIGLRADEKRRIDRLRNDARNEARTLMFPLSTAGVVKADIYSFWDVQPFRLDLPRGLGNCDHCPFLGIKDRVARAQLDPAGTIWWAQHEKARGGRFGRYHTYLELLGEAAQSPRLGLDDELDTECGAWCPSTTGGI